MRFYGAPSSTSGYHARFSQPENGMSPPEQLNGEIPVEAQAGWQKIDIHLNPVQFLQAKISAQSVEGCVDSSIL
jgi:hypothetical protein